MNEGKVYKNELPQGTLIEFTLHGNLSRVKGKICGMSTIENAIVGRGYIIEILSGISKEQYPYTHCVCHEGHFEVTQFVDDKIIK